MENQSCPQYDLEIPYGDRPGMTYDIYGTNLPENSPIFVFIHGGYWQMTSKSDNLFIVKPLVEAKVRVLMLGYDLCPSITLEELYNEVEVALAKILSMAKESHCSAVIVGGHSAGACLALAMVAKERRLPHQELLKALYLLGGIYDLTEARLCDDVNKDNLLSLTDENVKMLSPLLQDYNHLKDEDIKISIVIGEFDALGLIQQGLMLFAKLTNEGVNTEVVTAKSFDHFDLVAKLREPDCFLTKQIINECVGYIA